MTKFLFPIAIGGLLIAAPASANHVFHLDDPFPSRCV